MRFLKLLFIALFLAAGAWAQRAIHLDPEQDVKVAFQKGAVVVSVPEGAHLKKSFMAVTLKSKSGTLTVGALPKTTGVDELGDPVWHGSVRIPITGEGLTGTVELEVQYQPCTEGEGGVCFPPTSQTLKVKAAEIPGAKAEVKSGIPATLALESTAPAAAVSPVAVPQPQSNGMPAPVAPQNQGLILSLLLVFLAGMGASLTPCVFPMIPITMAIIGAKGGGKAKGFALSLMLVLGMAVTYTVLGVAAAKSGAAFGAAAQKPAFLIPMAILFAIFALSLFGAFEIQLPQSLQMKLQGSGPRQGYAGAFVMGLVLGPLAAPCVGPVIGAVLVAIAQRGDVILGAVKLFVFTLGMGVLFMLVGTFSATLPRSGDWLIRLKRIMGLAVLGFAVWSLRLIVPFWMLLAMQGALQLIGAAVFGVFEPAETFLGQIRKGIGVLLLVMGIFHWIRANEVAFDVTILPGGGRPAAVAETGPKLWLEQDLEGALAKAKAERKLVLVDVYAEWCAQCKELDEKTWPDPAVVAWIAKNAVAVRIDTDKQRQDLAKRLEIRSYPTVLLLDAEGKEQRRILGFTKAEGMLAWLEGR
jgi:thiol:disulfide interchange protein DsbD